MSTHAPNRSEDGEITYLPSSAFSWLDSKRSVLALAKRLRSPGRSGFHSDSEDVSSQSSGSTSDALSHSRSPSAASTYAESLTHSVSSVGSTPSTPGTFPSSPTPFLCDHDASLSLYRDSYKDSELPPHIETLYPEGGAQCRQPYSPQIHVILEESDECDEHVEYSRHSFDSFPTFNLPIRIRRLKNGIMRRRGSSDSSQSSRPSSPYPDIGGQQPPLNTSHNLRMSSHHRSKSLPILERRSSLPSCAVPLAEELSTHNRSSFDYNTTSSPKLKRSSSCRREDRGYNAGNSGVKSLNDKHPPPDTARSEARPTEYPPSTLGSLGSLKQEVIIPLGDGDAESELDSSLEGVRRDPEIIQRAPYKNMASFRILRATGLRLSAAGVGGWEQRQQHTTIIRLFQGAWFRAAPATLGEYTIQRYTKNPYTFAKASPQRAQPAPQAPHSPSLPPMSESDDTSSVAEAQAESQMASPESGFRDSGISLRCDAEHNCTASAGGCLCQLRNDSTDKVHEDIEDFYIQDFTHQPDISQQYPGWINPEFWNLPQSNIDGSLASDMVADCDPMNEDYDGYASGQNHAEARVLSLSIEDSEQP
ncbi:unnamed protein product [Parascedosporium putredinis]|uniref:Uncharacterized protein n=1 Tax=Parascedosporium putredinis TaxID=1442378 RepID=A0A9P1GUG4_9PEZI|nr:unnamed protein product [Parascedosporium putredinis]CAI7987859.1 unnamed protein product [Parascedosporium putredinis]